MWRAVGRVIGGRCQRLATRRLTTLHVCKTRGCYCSFRLLMMGGVSPGTYKYEIKFGYTVASYWIFFVNLELLYCISKSPTLVPVVSQINPIYIFTARLIQKYFKFIFLLQPHLSRNLFPYSFPTYVLYAFYISYCMLHVLRI
jgi:hypothetical protein